MNIFDINTPESFFHSITRRYSRYQLTNNEGGRTTEDLLYVIMGLYHLREWIAPMKMGGKYLETCSIEAKEPSERLHNITEFVALRDVTNGLKHLKTSVQTTSVSANLPIDDWPNFDDTLSVDSGPPDGHYINETKVDQYIDPIISIYQEWFSQP